MAASIKQIKEESKKKRLRRQWDLLVKRADAWFKECEQPPNFVMMVLRGDRVEWKAPDHMSAFANSPNVVDKFKEVSLGRLYMPSQRNGKAAYRPENRPSWWPRDVCFCSPNSDTQENKRHSVAEMRMALESFLQQCRNEYIFAEKLLKQEELLLPSEPNNIFQYHLDILESIAKNQDSAIKELCRCCGCKMPPGKKKRVQWIGCGQCGDFWIHYQCMKTNDS